MKTMPVRILDIKHERLAYVADPHGTRIPPTVRGPLRILILRTMGLLLLRKWLPVNPPDPTFDPSEHACES